MCTNGAVVRTQSRRGSRDKQADRQRPAQRAVGRVAFAGGGRWRWRGSMMELRLRVEGERLPLTRARWIAFASDARGAPEIHANRGNASAEMAYMCVTHLLLRATACSLALEWTSSSPATRAARSSTRARKEI